MEYIRGWILGVISCKILSMMILELVVSENYKKYVRFFSGMLMIIIMITPISNIIDEAVNFKERYYEKKYIRELKELDRYEEMGLNKYEEEVYKEYSKLIEQQVRTIVEGEKLVLNEIKVGYEKTEDNIKIDTIHIKVAAYKDLDNRVRAQYEDYIREDNDISKVKEIYIKNKIDNFYKIGLNNIIYEEQ